MAAEKETGAVAGRAWSFSAENPAEQRRTRRFRHFCRRRRGSLLPQKAAHDCGRCGSRCGHCGNLGRSGPRRRAQRLAAEKPGSAPRCPELAAVRPLRIKTRVAAQVLLPPVLAPFPDIAVHFVKTPGIGRQALHRHGAAAEFALGAVAVGKSAVAVGLLRRDLSAKGEQAAAACPAGVFPLRLGRQAGVEARAPSRSAAGEKAAHPPS